MKKKDLKTIKMFATLGMTVAVIAVFAVLALLPEKND